MANYVFAAFLGNLFIAIIKFIAGFATASSTMISEGLHSLADTSNQLLIALGLKRSKRDPDIEHPFGYSKAQFFWALIVSILIFTLAGTLSTLHGIERLMEGHFEVHESFSLNYIVLFLAIVFEGIALYLAYKEFKHIKVEKQYTSNRETIANLGNPALLTVLVEDSLAMVGILLALIATFLTDITHDAIFDSIGSIFIGLILMIGALLLARENKSYLIGKAISNRDKLKIKDVILTSPGVLDFKGMKTMVMGPDNFIISLEVDFADSLSVQDIENSIDAIETKLIEMFPKLTREKIFIEPN